MSPAAFVPAALLALLLAAPAATAEEAPVHVRDWFVVGCTSPLFVVDEQDDRVGVLVGQGHFGPDWEWGCLYRGPVGPSKICIVNNLLENKLQQMVACVLGAMAE